MERFVVWILFWFLVSSTICCHLRTAPTSRTYSAILDTRVHSHSQFLDCCLYCVAVGLDRDITAALVTVFPGKPGLASFPSVFPPLVSKQPLGINVTGCFASCVLRVTQPTVSKHWRKHKALGSPAAWSYPFFIYYRTPDGRDIASCPPPVPAIGLRLCRKCKIRAHSRVNCNWPSSDVEFHIRTVVTFDYWFFCFTENYFTCS